MTELLSANQSMLSCVAILAGGMGTRLLDRCGSLPKPMAPVLGKPILQHQIDLCRKYGFNNILLLVHHRHELISEYFGNGASFGVSIKYSIEGVARGTSGAIRDALPELADRFLVLYGDTFIDVDLREIWSAHEFSDASGTLLLHPNDHPYDSDIVQIDNSGTVRAILPYPHPKNRESRNLVNAALYVLEKSGLEDVTPIDGKADIAKDMFPRMLELGRKLHGYVTPEYIKDMGTPDRLDKVERDFVAGLPERLSSRGLRTAVFLDRDGTLIREVNHLKSINQVELLSGVSDAVRKLNRSGILAVVTTNQPVVARGDITLDELDQIHARLESQLGMDGAYIDGLYLCPHHPDKGFPGELIELKRKCLCRKPETGLFDQACRDLLIDRRASWMIGDTTIDVKAGNRAGLRTILLRTGYGGSDGKYLIRPDYICPDLPDAVEWILNGHFDLSRRMIPVVAEASSGGRRLVLIGGLARAGKSFAAQVLKELLLTLGHQAHVISLDGWLKPKNQRYEGAGVRERYDLSSASVIISNVARATTRETLREPLYDRLNRTAGLLEVEHSVGPEDILIVEGVPGLLMEELNIMPNTLKVYVDIDPVIRKTRLAKDYLWRSETTDEYENVLALREVDETPIVLNSRNNADFLIEQSNKRPTY